MEIIFIQAWVWGKWGSTTLTFKQKIEFILELNMMNDHDWRTQI